MDKARPAAVGISLPRKVCSRDALLAAQLGVVGPGCLAACCSRRGMVASAAVFQSGLVGRSVSELAMLTLGSLIFALPCPSWHTAAL